MLRQRRENKKSNTRQNRISHEFHRTIAVHQFFFAIDMFNALNLVTELLQQR